MVLLSGWLLQPVTAQVVISEFLAVNDSGLKDEDGERSDWIELKNVSTNTVNLLGWHLTDNAAKPAKWTFPSVSLAPGQFLVVFASNKNRAVAGHELHTNFKLDSGGEYLALTRPDNSVASEFSPTFPLQGPDIAYGSGSAAVATTNLLTEGTVVQYLVPTNGSVDGSWMQPAFDSSAWSNGPSPLGFDTTGAFRSYSDVILDEGPLFYWNFNEPSGVALNQANPAIVQDSLTPQGAATRVAHTTLPLGNAASLGGADGSRYYAANLSPGSDIRGSWAVEFWLQNSSPTKATYFMEVGATAGAYNSPGLIEGYNGSRLEIFGSASGRTGADGPLFSASGWHHLVFGYFGSAAGDGVANRHDIYVDGVRVSSQTGDFTSALVLGGGGIGVGGTLNGVGLGVLNGQMDEVAVYDLRALANADAVSNKLASMATNHYRAALTTNFGAVFATDLRTPMAGRASSLYVRHAFALTNATGLNQLTLSVKYADAFIAWLNGVRVASANAPETAAYNSTALTNRLPREATVFSNFDLSAFVGLLTAGTNMLAIQGLSSSTSDTDFLLSAQLTAATAQSQIGYLIPPTPGQPNGTVLQRVGPLVSEVTENPPRPTAGQDLVITTRVAQALAAVTNVQLIYRIIYGSEMTVAMQDNGIAPDTTAGDGIFSAAIPGSAFTAGQMIRWAVLAADATGTSTRAPLFLSATNSPQYFGTVAVQPAATSSVPILEWFLTPGTEAAARTLGGTRASLFFNGEFYDNVWVHLRGRTAASLDKNPYEFGFNSGNLFRFDPKEPRVDQFALNTTWRDKSYVRPVLGFGLFHDAGVAASACFPLQVRQNNQFFSVALFVEIPDRQYLRRQGLDPDGALYKANLNGFTVEAQGGYLPAQTGFEKKTPDDGDFSDIIAFAQGLALSGDARTRFVFDNVNLPATVNYLAVCVIIQDADRLVTNFYPYRDTFGTGEWTMLPWDLDLTLGQVNNSVDEIQTAQDNPIGASHPFYGNQTLADYRNPALWNKLIDVLTTTPLFREMYVRRLRTLMDQFLKAPGTPADQLYFEPQINYWKTALAPDYTLDRAKWPMWGQQQTLSQALDLIGNAYLPGRRQHLFTNHSVLTPSYPNNAGIPLAQTASPTLRFGAMDFNPVSGNQDEEYFQVTNLLPTSVDISGWRVSDGVDFTFQPGTVIPSNSVLHVAKNVRAFRARAASPRGGEGLFVQGGYSGQLSARGETLQLRDAAGALITTTNFPGNPSLAQLNLRVTELMYHPSALAGNINPADEFEFIELHNISTNTAIDLNGVRFTNGVDFSFSGSAVTNLAAGQRVLVVKNTNAFAARYGAGLNIAGQYSGALENNGERLTLLDARGEEILDFTYDNRWYPITDGLGFSLVVVDELAEPDRWSDAMNWRSSGVLGGSPGGAESVVPVIVPVLINEALTASIPPDVDQIELFNPTTNTASIGGWFLSDDLATPAKFRIPDGRTIAPGGCVVFTEADFNLVGASFALGSDGDELYLFSADAAGNLTGFLHGFSFGAAEPQVTFGRYVNSQGTEFFVAQSTNTLGSTNAPPSVGPLVISEIMFNPPAVGTNDGQVAEFIELHNITDTNVALFDPSRPLLSWHLRNAVDFDFPTNLTVAPSASLVIVGFDPATNAAALADFRSRYGLDTNTPLFGPWSGQLNNAGETVELKKPVPSTGTNVSYALVEEVAYQPDAPWPTNTSDTTLSLQRRNLTTFGNEPTNWFAAAPSPGAVVTNLVAPTIVGDPTNLTVQAGQNAAFRVTATGSAPLYYQWRFNSADLLNATNSVLTLTNVQSSQAGPYSVFVFNSVGGVSSTNALLTVIVPVTIVQQPQSLTVAVGSNVTFRVVATGNGTLTYQWRRNGTDLPNATNSTLAVPNASPPDSGAYSVLVSDAFSSLLSQTAQLTVLTAPTIVEQPRSQWVVVSNPATFRVVVNSYATTPIGYRWRRATTTLTNIVSSQTTCTFTIPRVLTTDAGNYTVIITNAASSGVISSAASLTVLADSDGDGLPDVWMVQYFGHTNALASDHSRALDDPDGDGMLNGQEYMAGTNPTNAASYLKVEALANCGQAVVNFAAVSNRTYIVSYTDGLEPSNWMTLTNVAPRSTNWNVTIPDPTAHTNRFYRLVIPASQ